MKTNDKALVAFLVSVGVFSATQASLYVETLSPKDKQSLSQTVSKAQKSSVTVEPSGPDWDPTQD